MDYSHLGTLSVSALLEVLDCAVYYQGHDPVLDAPCDHPHCTAWGSCSLHLVPGLAAQAVKINRPVVQFSTTS